MQKIQDQESKRRFFYIRALHKCLRNQGFDHRIFADVAEKAIFCLTSVRWLYRRHQKNFGWYRSRGACALCCVGFVLIPGRCEYKAQASDGY
jgi:hypothetical protein